MTAEQFMRNLQTPAQPVDVVLDSDAYNEIDDPFAIAYALRSPERLCVKGFCAAPFWNENSSSPEDGMQRSYEEIRRVLCLAGRKELLSAVYRGAAAYLPDERTPVPSEAADFLTKLSAGYSADRPLYIVAIGAITNVASALLADPDMRERVVVVWLGGHAHHYRHNREFNMMQDVAAARVVFGSGVPLVQVPCGGVADRFAASRYELEHWLKGKNPLADDLLQKTIAAAERYASGKPWTRVIWDVTAVAWLLNDDGRFLSDELRHSPIPEYDDRYAFDRSRHLMRYVTEVNRDALFEDLFAKLAAERKVEES